jgi:hypothetical protein
MAKQVLSELQERRLKGPVTGKGQKVKKTKSKKETKKAPPKKEKKNTPFSARDAVRKIREKQYNDMKSI